MRAVYDAALLVDAMAFADPKDFTAWPDIPPFTDQPARDCLAAVASAPAHGHDVELVLSRGVLEQVHRTLREDLGLAQQDIDAYLLALMWLAAEAGTRPVADPPAGDVHVPGHAGLLLRLALGPYGDGLVVTASACVLALGPRWRGEVYILPAVEFARRVDASRRGR